MYIRCKNGSVFTRRFSCVSYTAILQQEYHIVDNIPALKHYDTLLQNQFPNVLMLSALVPLM